MVDKQIGCDLNQEKGVQNTQSILSDKEVEKWRKAYYQEKQNHKLTKTVLDQALALSMKLLGEIK